MPPAPSAGKLLAENNLSADQVDGSGKRGQVLKGDVLAAVAKGISAPAASEPVKVQARAPSTTEDVVREERVKMTRLRQTIARRLKDAQNTAAMLTTYNEVDMSAVMSLRNKYKDIFEKKHGVKLGFMGFFTKAVTHALKEIPAVNAEIDGTDVIYKNFCQSASPSAPTRVLSFRSFAMPTRCRSPRSRRTSAAWASLPVMVSSPWPTCRAALSPSPTVASTVR